MRQPNQRFTRGQMHRVLKANDVEHDVNWGAEALYNLIIQHGLNKPIEPGIIEEKEDEITALKKRIAELEGKNNVVPIRKEEVKKPELMKDGWPRSVFVLRKWCRDRNIPCTNKDKRIELIAKLKNGDAA